MAEDAVRYELRERVAVIRLDDGKANALSPAVVAALQGALDRAEKDAGAVLLIGRPERLCAGFDLKVMRSGPEPLRELVTAGAELMLRLFGYPRPVVLGCTGHAIAAGALLLLSADARIGARGDFKIGLNEVGIGMTLPIFAFELARQRLSKRHLTRATTQAELYSPDGALDAGYLDRVVSPDVLFDTALAEAVRLAKLPQPAFEITKRRLRDPVIASIRETLTGDMSRLAGPNPK